MSLVTTRQGGRAQEEVPNDWRRLSDEPAGGEGHYQGAYATGV